MKSVITLLSGCCLITLLSGCASVICGSKQSVAINSKPIGADVQIYNANGEIIFHKTTPCVAKLAIEFGPRRETSAALLFLAGEIWRSKFQNPNPKSQENPKPQISKRIGVIWRASGSKV